MQKKLKFLFMVASLAIAATVVFIACGGGELIYEDQYLAEVNDARDGNLLDNGSRMSAIMDDPDFVPLSSSSEKEKESSSSEEDQRPSSTSKSSSSQTSDKSSSSVEKSSSSVAKSSSSVAKSSSSATPAPSGSCKENDPKDGFKCEWNVSGTLTPGTTLKPKDPKAPSGCSDVKWYYAPGTSAMTLKNECEVVPEEGFKALGSKEYVLFAELTCDGKKQTTACEPKAGLSSKEAPVLKGECKWDKNPPEVTAARGAVPSGVTVDDVDKICTNPTVVYKYADGTKDWPKSGVLDEWKEWGKNDSETYNVEATLNCPAYPQTVTSPCPALKVSGGVEHIIECTCPGNGQCDLNSATVCKTDAKGGNTVTLLKDECVEVRILGYDNPHYLPTLGMRCSTKSNSAFTVTVNGKTTQVPGNGLVPLGTVVEGDNEFGTLCMTTDTTVECKGPGN